MGNPYHPDTISEWLNQKQKASGLPRIRLHDCRHTAASLMLAAGVPVNVVQEMLGHSSPTITMSIYAHVLPSMAEQAGVELSESLLGPSRWAVGRSGCEDGVLDERPRLPTVGVSDRVVVGLRPDQFVGGSEVPRRHEHSDAVTGDPRCPPPLCAVVKLRGLRHARARCGELGLQRLDEAGEESPRHVSQPFH